MHRRAVGVFALGLGLIACAPLPIRTAAPITFLPSPQVDRPHDPPGAAAAIAFAEAQVGKRYCWGGSGPSCFDCSGLVQAAWRVGGLDLPRTSTGQGRVLSEVPFSDLRPGDILWWRGHVGIYVGRG